jgi:GTPase SAR1 family protein
MGNCGGVSDPITQEIDIELARASIRNKSIYKLLFLGSGGSGKSTFFKQMTIIDGYAHGESFTEKERHFFHIEICAQILKQMMHMIDCVSLMNEYLPDLEMHSEPLQLSEDEKVATAAAHIMSLNLREIITKEIADSIEILWYEQVIKTVYNTRARLQVDDSISYFLSEIHRIAEPAYIPSNEDIIQVRTRTTSIISKEFDIKGNTFCMFDVGGQKSERKKWIHCFENVTAVIFVASLSCYDEYVVEENDQHSNYKNSSKYDETAAANYNNNIVRTTSHYQTLQITNEHIPPQQVIGLSPTALKRFNSSKHMKKESIGSDSSAYIMTNNHHNNMQTALNRNPSGISTQLSTATNATTLIINLNNNNNNNNGYGHRSGTASPNHGHGLIPADDRLLGSAGAGHGYEIDSTPAELDTNAMYDTLELFGEICCNFWLRNASIMLFLNKNDLFKEKIKHIPLNAYFNDFREEADGNMDIYDTDVGYKKCLEFIRGKFEERYNMQSNLTSNEGREIYIHVTTATDTDNVSKVFNDVQHTIVSRMLSTFLVE